MARRTLDRAERELRALKATSALAANLTIERQRSTNALDDVARFVESRRSMLRMLASVSRALPESTAIASLRVDTVGGALVLVSAAGPALVAPLARLDVFADVQLAGTITREAIGPAELQRLTVRFRHVIRRRLSP
jgi:hypothetical protein